MRKKLITGMLLFLAIGANAQFSHSAGLTLFSASASDGNSAIAYGGTYFPSYSFGAISVGVPITVGVAGSVNSRVGASTGSSFTYQIPLMVQYNYGLGSGDNTEDDFGFYGGIGYATFTTAYVGIFDNGTIKANGPMVHLGGNFKFKDKIVGLKFSYMKGGGDAKANVLGLTALYRL